MQRLDQRRVHRLIRIPAQDKIGTGPTGGIVQFDEQLQRPQGGNHNGLGQTLAKQFAGRIVITGGLHPQGAPGIDVTHTDQRRKQDVGCFAAFADIAVQHVRIDGQIEGLPPRQGARLLSLPDGRQHGQAQNQAEHSQQTAHHVSLLIVDVRRPPDQPASYRPGRLFAAVR